MVVKISSEASAQLTSNSIFTYTNCKLYNYNDSFLTDLDVINASWSQSRKYGVSVLNLTVLNTDGKHNYGAQFEFKQDYLIVLREGYITNYPTDKFPKFKGYIKNISFDVKENIINLTVYDELILTQRSDIDHVFAAETTLVENEVMIPIVEPITTVLETPVVQRTRLVYNLNNYALDKLVTDRYFFVGNTMYRIVNVNLTPDGKRTNEIFINGSITGTLLAGDVVTNASRTYYATVRAGVTSTRYGEPVLLVNDIFGNFSNNDILYKLNNTSVYFTAKSFYELNVVEYDSASVFTFKQLNFNTNDVVHNGMVSSYRSIHPNWARFKTHSLQITETGLISDDDVYSGYEVNHDRGIIRLNHPVRVDKYKVTSTYEYFPVGLYIEDVLSDILTLSDGLTVNIVNNGSFKQLTTGWNNYYGGGAVTSDYITSTGDGIDIKIINNLNSGEYVGVQQSGIPVLSGYTYTVSALVKLNMGVSGIFNIQMLNGSYSNIGSNLNSGVTEVSFTVTPTSSTNTVLKVFVSGADVDAGNIWNINDIRITYNPSKINSLSTNNLYCTVAVENGSASAYRLTTNTSTTTIPRYAWLTSDINNSTTTINVDNTIGFESSGYVLIGAEYLHYTGLTLTSFTGVSRGQLSSTQSNHDIGVKVWQALGAGRVWYMEYTNIIPKTISETASTYNSVNGVNVGSAGSFTISGASFSEFFYREGLLITDTASTGVRLTSNMNYYFNQIQSTGVELSYILLDYRNIDTRFDAINQVRELVAPNYVLSTVVRSAATDTYTTFVKARYLTQKSYGNQDYNLQFIENIVYNNDIDTYNRVKMFGKLSNVSNLMYNPKTTLTTINQLGTEYIRGVEYNYVGGDGIWSYYSSNVESNIARNEIKSIPLGYEFGKFGSSFVFPILRNEQINTQNLLCKLITFQEYHKTRYSNLICGCKIYPSIISNEVYNNLPVVMVEVYNIYFVNYTKGLSFTVGDRLTTNATIKEIKQLDEAAPYDSIIYVEHDLNRPIYTQGQSIVNTTNTTSATIYTVILDGNTQQVNYNTLDFDYINIGGFYDVSYNTFDKYNQFTTETIVNPIEYKLNIDGYPVNSEPVYEEELKELGELVKYKEVDYGNFINPNISRYYRRSLSGAEIYLNTVWEYLEHPYIPSGKLIPFGTVRFEQQTGDGNVNNLLLLEYQRQSPYHAVITSDAEINTTLGTLTQQIRNGGFLYYGRDQGTEIGNDIVKSAIMNATHIRYYRKYGARLNWELYNNYVRISNEDLSNSDLKPDEIDVTLDGQFYTKIPLDTISDSDLTNIERIRDFTGKGRDQQIGIISKTPISEIPLCVIDLGSIKSVKYIDIQPGFLFKPIDTGDDAPYDCSFKITLKHCAKDIINVQDADYVDISDETKNIEASSGEIITIEESQLGEYFKTRYLKIFASTSDKANLTIGTEAVPIDWYAISISGIAIYESDMIVSERYVNSGLINLYKDSTVYEQLYTQELLDLKCQNRLNEFQKDRTSVSANSQWSPQYEVGQTVYIDDSESNSPARNYFIESITSNNGQIKLDLAYYA